MALFTSLAVATFLGLTAGTFTAVVAFGLNMAVIGLAEFALSYAAKAISGNKNEAQSATDSFGVQGTLQAGGDVPRSFPLGYSVTAGQLVYANTHGGDSATPNAYLTQVIKLSDLPGCKLVGLWVNGEKCTLSAPLSGSSPGAGAGYQVPEYIKPRNPDFPADTAPHLYIKFYDGTQTTADPYLVDTVASDDRPYPDTRVGVGCAYVMVTSLTNDSLFTGFPAFKFELSSIPLYDVSKDSSAGGSGTHRFDDPASWGGDGDDFPPVQTYNILKGFYFNGIWLYGLQTMTPGRLPAANWIAQIGKCRTATTGESGDEPTYRSGMQINVDAQPANALPQLLSACQGKISEIGGFYKIRLGAPDSPTFDFSDDDILSSETQVHRPFFALDDSVNGIQGKYPDPSQGWNYATAPAYYRSDLEAKDGNRRLMASPKFDAVPYAAQVQRLQKSAIEEGQRARTHTIVLPPEFWIVEPGDVGTWTSARNGYSAKQFRCDGAIDKANLDAALSLTEVDPSDFDWDHATEFKPVSSGPTMIPRPAPQGVLDWFAEPATLYDADGIGRRPAIRLAWDGTVPGVVGVTYEVRLAADNSDVTKGRTDQLAAGAIIVSQSLIPATAYQVRGQYLPSWPRDMLWSDWLDVTTPDVKLTMADLDASIVAAINGLEQFDASAISQAINLIASLAANQDARNWLDKKEIRSQLNAVAGGASAAITEIQSVMADDEAAFAEFQTTVNATFGAGFSEVSTVADAVATLNGYAASLTIDTNVNGYIVGTRFINGGPGAGEIVFQADKFQWQLPGYNSNAPITPLTLGTIAGSPAFGFSGAMYLDGTFNARAVISGTITGTMMVAQTVNTAQLAIGGVDISNIIDGATSNTGSIATSGVANASTPTSTGTLTLNIQQGRAIVLGMASGGYAFGPNGDGARIYVDGVATGTFFETPGALDNLGLYIAGNFMAMASVTGLSAGNHNFEMRVKAKQCGAGALVVINPRR